MGRKKAELDDKVICEEYLNSNIGVEALATKYHTGKVTVKKILADNGIEIKPRGKQPLKEEFVVNDWKEEKYLIEEGFHYIAKAKDSDYETNDYMNAGGHLTSYIKKKFGITSTLYERRMHYKRTGNYWWEQWFDIVKVADKPVKKCPYCDWTTEDIQNRSGVFEQHLVNVHNKTKIEYLSEFPTDKDYFIGASRTKNRQMETNVEKFVTCKICGKKLDRISNTHLKTHNITKHEYLLKYGNELYTKDYYQTLLKSAHTMNTSLMNNLSQYSSKDENFLMDYIKSKGIECYKDRQILDGKEIDIYIPSYSIGIEYNGNKWHTENFGKKDKTYHLNKLECCKANGVQLLSIFEDEFVYHRELVLSKIDHILGLEKEKKKIPARKCIIKEISKNDAEVFLEQFHIQGFVSSSLYLGAFYNCKLIAVMTFIEEHPKQWNLTRFASDINYVCQGVGGKLFSYFKKNFSFETVKSFLDRRWCFNEIENIYTKLGFTFDSYNKPDYRYYNETVDRYKRFHKFGFRKDRLLKLNENFTPDMTELEMTKALGYERIWDCGLIKYIYKK